MFNLDNAFRDFFKLKGFKKEPLKEKIRWIATYPLLGIVYFSLILSLLIDKFRR
jgi:hypothetical protein